VTVPNFKFDVRPDADQWIHFDSFSIKLVLDYDGATISGKVPFSATMTMNFTRTVTEVPDSYKRVEIDGKLIDQMAYDEYIYVINPLGTLAVSDEEFCYLALPFSTQDYPAGLTDYRYAPVSILNTLWRGGAPDANNPRKKLLPVLDANGNPTGASLFYQRVYVEWVWQAHPNPVKITSVDHAGITASGGTFQVTADGYAPFAFSLTDAPEGVTIDRNTGLLAVVEGTPAETYTFTVRAEENRESYQMTLPDGTVVDQSKRLGPYEGNDPSPPDEQLFTLIVSEPLAPPPTPEPTPEPTSIPTPTTAPRTVPKIAAAKHNYAFEMAEGGRGLSIQVTASGSTPITWSLQSLSKYPDYPFPSSASIDAKTGLLTIGPDIAAGTYRFAIHAQNDVGEDNQECSLDVMGTAPVILEEEHNYAFEIYKRKEDVNIPIYATGTLPIAWSLEPTYPDNEPLPEALAIDPQTGVLTIRQAISVGNYYFTIRATNDVGSDTQECTLKVNFPLPFSLNDTPTSLPAPDDYRLLSSLSGYAKDFFAEAPSISQEFFSSDGQFAFDVTELQLTPPNVLTLRYDDPNDVYTEDRWTKNGAAFVRWHSSPGVLQRFNHFNDVFWEGGTGTIFLDTSPRSDNYHYHKQESGSVAIDDVLQHFQERIVDYYQEVINPSQFFDRSDLTGYFDPVANQRRSRVTYLNYGTTVDLLNKSKGETFDVRLDQYTGALVSGKFFTALQNNEKAALSFLQEGAAITFHSQDIGQITDNKYFDLSYSIGSIHDQDMLANLEPGGQHFTCGFAENGDLPGLATFTITTGLAQGTQVNVYQFDATSGQFNLIADEISVDRNGAVTYRNNELSNYLITTQTLQGVAVSDVASLQSFTPDRRVWLIAVGIALLLAAGAVVWFMLRRKKRV
ncbi:MAG: hypothetical protein SCM11_10070, partial [Bacillota bacterium]|nr:hypothetical protein [Bacillota bacterium]